MRPSDLPYFQLLLATTSTRLVNAFPLDSLAHTTAAIATPHDVIPGYRQHRHQDQHQQPLMAPAPTPAPTPPQEQQQQQQQQQSAVLLSDVLGRDRSVNAFAGFARDSEAVALRLDDAARRSTVLAPLNSAIVGDGNDDSSYSSSSSSSDSPRRQRGRPWEDPREYAALGADAYEGDDGRARACRNLRRLVEAHIVPACPWPEGRRARTLLGGREVWWETRAADGVRVVSFFLSFTSHTYLPTYLSPCLPFHYSDPKVTDWIGPGVFRNLVSPPPPPPPPPPRHTPRARALRRCVTLVCSDRRRGGNGWGVGHWEPEDRFAWA